MIKAFITGITGQNGSYLADLLLNNGYEVHARIDHASTFNTARIDHIKYDARYERPAEVDLLIGDPAKTKNNSAGNPKSASRKS